MAHEGTSSHGVHLWICSGAMNSWRRCSRYTSIKMAASRWCTQGPNSESMHRRGSSLSVWRRPANFLRTIHRGRTCFSCHTASIAWWPISTCRTLGPCYHSPLSSRTMSKPLPGNIRIGIGPRGLTISLSPVTTGYFIQLQFQDRLLSIIIRIVISNYFFCFCLVLAWTESGLGFCTRDQQPRETIPHSEATPWK